MDRTPAWIDKGRLRLAVDGRSADFKIAFAPASSAALSFDGAGRSPGPFRIAPYEAPSTATTGTGATARKPVTTPELDAKVEEAKQLVNQLQGQKRGSKPARNLPLRVAFPHFGPSIFLKAELTSENQTPVAELDFQRDRKRGQ